MVGFWLREGCVWWVFFFFSVSVLLGTICILLVYFGACLWHFYFLMNLVLSIKYIYIYSCLGGVQVQELDLPTCKWISLVFQSLAFIPLLLFCSLKFCFRYSCSPHFLELKICRDVS